MSEELIMQSHRLYEVKLTGTECAYHYKNDFDEPFIVKTEMWNEYLQNVRPNYIMLNRRTNSAAENDPKNVFITRWETFKKIHMNEWDRIYDAITAEYNPIENYNGHEESTTEDLNRVTVRTGSETDQLEKLGKQTDKLTKTGSEKRTITDDAHTDTSENEVAPDNAESFYNNTKDTNIYGEAKTHDDLSFTSRSDTSEQTFDNRKDINTKTYNSVTDTTNGKVKYTMDKSGNLGVTSSQDMINQEIELRKFSLAEYIINSFLDYVSYYVS